MADLETHLKNIIVAFLKPFLPLEIPRNWNIIVHGRMSLNIEFLKAGRGREGTKSLGNCQYHCKINFHTCFFSGFVPSTKQVN